MQSFATSVLFLCSIFSLAHSFRLNDRQSSVTWSSCDELLPGAPNPNVECTRLNVPRDYTDEASGTTVSLALVRSQASTQPSKGSVILNFGGPGGDGLQNLPFALSGLRKVIGDEYDLVSFTPRGVSNATLPFRCYDNPDEERRAAYQFPDYMTANSSDAAPGRLWAIAKQRADSCYSVSNETGSVISTAFVARDVMQIVDALEDDGLLRYYGYSYGTILGATLAAMFPDRIERLVLDGVWNPHEYYNSYPIEFFHDTQKVYEGFLASCIEAGPSLCRLASEASTAQALQTRIDEALENLKYNPLPNVPIPNRMMDYSWLRFNLFQSLYNPASWPTAAFLLQGLLANDFSEYSARLNVPSAYPGQAGGIIPSTVAIWCGDNIPRSSSLASLQPVLSRASEISNGWSEMNTGTMSIFTCAQWRMEAKERYTGNFRAQTRHPLLIVGNLAGDPATPLVSAYNVSAGFEGSVVLEHNGIGHCSTAQPSSCTDDAIRAYFATGELPMPGTVCEPDEPPFVSQGELADRDRGVLRHRMPISLLF